MGSLAGRLVFTRAGELRHGVPKEDRVPAVGARPTGQYVAPVPDPIEVERARAQKFVPIALEDEG